MANTKTDAPVNKENLYEVLRPFEADNGKLAIGTVVDTTNWKWTQNLVRSRYLRKVSG